MNTLAHSMEYVYPDIRDALVANFVKTSYGENRWRSETLWVLGKLKDLAELLWGHKSCRARIGLDIGSGCGRLVGWLKAMGLTPIALDPDPSRLKEASKRVGVAGGAVLADGAYLPFKDNAACLVLISHVLQHIATWKTPLILSETYRVLEPGGIAIVMTTHSEKGEEYFLLVSKDGSREVSVEKYKKMAKKPAPWKLPVRKFNLKSLEELIGKTGFKIMARYFYHTRGNIDVERANTLPWEEARRVTIDVAYLVVKPGG